MLYDCTCTAAHALGHAGSNSTASSSTSLWQNGAYAAGRVRACYALLGVVALAAGNFGDFGFSGVLAPTLNGLHRGAHTQLSEYQPCEGEKIVIDCELWQMLEAYYYYYFLTTHSAVRMERLVCCPHKWAQQYKRKALWQE